ncbi:tetratricopeptide repeat protein [Mucilaginibacter sp. dw_454]|uniref:tetratricopeptide repeat protein n=1 Tax=Mucilaginibacter sp. dw_454 TaxID=2720079 RepID=UPI001BD33BDC|nr:tetratricopeptide repeat protein [Mucilaginibacter sp. dw_454]
MKNVLVFFLCLMAFPSIAQQLTYTQFKQDASSAINLQPEYGGLAKTKEQTEEDNTFIKAALSQYPTRLKASAHMVELGFKYLYQGDIETAMKRFNQAWLLEPKNENVYWGYGAVYFTFGDNDEALRQLDKGLTINPESSNLLTDKATIYTSYFFGTKEMHYLDDAINLFIKSYNIDPNNQNTLFKLSAAYFYKQDCTNAKRYYDECMKLGGQPIPKGYSDDLQKQCGK